MKVYTIIGGVNGVGKSSLTGVLRSTEKDMGVVIDTDKITAEVGGERLKGGKAAARLIAKCLSDGVNFTQESTLSGVKTLKTIQRARDLDYCIRLFYVGLNTSEESISRIQNRVRKGGHNINSEDVLRRFDKRFEDLARILPFCDEVRFWDNDNGFAEVAAYCNGMLYLPINAPMWVQELDEFLQNQKEQIINEQEAVADEEMDFEP